MKNSIYYQYGYIMMPCSFSLLPEIEIKNQIYFCKKSFHISLLCVYKYANALAKIKNISIAKSTTEILKFSNIFFEKNQIEFIKLSPDIRLASKDGQKSIIIGVKLLRIDQYSKFLTDNLGINIETPPVHVTLFTSANSTGIGINDKSDFDNLTFPFGETDKEIVKKSIISYKF